MTLKLNWGKFKRKFFVGPWLKEFRLQKRITRRYVAEKLGLSQGVIAQMEAGNINVKTPALLRRWLKLLDEPRIDEGYMLLLAGDHHLQWYIHNMSLEDRLRVIGLIGACNRGIPQGLRNEIDRVLADGVELKESKMGVGSKWSTRRWKIQLLEDDDGTDAEDQGQSWGEGSSTGVESSAGEDGSA